MVNAKTDSKANNLTYLKEWDEYSATKANKRQTLLLPIKLGIGKKGEILRRRMNQPEVQSFYSSHKKDIPSYISSESNLFPNPDEVFEDYLEYFSGEGTESSSKPKPTPLDWNVDRPVFLLYTFFHEETWRFSEKTQFSTVNDPDDVTRNMVKISTMNDNKALLMWNRCRSNPENLKFNLHVSVHQSERGPDRRKIDFRTDILIDPRGGNAGDWPL